MNYDVGSSPSREYIYFLEKYVGMENLEVAVGNIVKIGTNNSFSKLRTRRFMVVN